MVRIERGVALMTTDNRTNEPTEAMVLAALNAYSNKGLEIDGYDSSDEYLTLKEWGERFASQMRAALVAAAGAAPQTEPVHSTQAETVSEPDEQGEKEHEERTSDQYCQSDNGKLLRLSPHKRDDCEGRSSDVGAVTKQGCDRVTEAVGEQAATEVDEQEHCPAGEDCYEGCTSERCKRGVGLSHELNLAGVVFPVQPSSTVDEEKIAEVINSALDAWEGDEPSEVFVARAVVEAIGGESRAV